MKPSCTTEDNRTRQYSKTLSGSKPPNSAKKSFRTKSNSHICVTRPITCGSRTPIAAARAYPIRVSHSVLYCLIFAECRSKTGMTLDSIRDSQPVPTDTTASTTDFKVRSPITWHSQNHSTLCRLILIPMLLPWAKRLSNCSTTNRYSPYRTRLW